MRREKSKKKYFYLFLLIVLALGALKLLPEIEWKAPRVGFLMDSEYVGVKPFEIELSDEGKGLRSVEVTIEDEHGKVELFSRTFEPPVESTSIELRLDSSRIGQGRAVLRVDARDASRLRVFTGNRTVAKRDVVVDFKPPAISALTTEHYVNFGGSGIVIYSVSDEAVRSGVEIGDYFFPGSLGYFKNPNVGFALFTHPYDVESDVPAQLVAEDRAGNVGRRDFPYYLRVKRYESSTIEISDDFIRRKVAPLLSPPPEGDSPKEIFLAVNRDMRRRNNEAIGEITSQITPSFLWNGPFHQLSNSQVKANFAEHRTYVYNGETIDEQYHLGYDLAVVERYPIEVANGGKVAFVGDLGIYGQSVVIDHGYGLFTLYSHMSSVDVERGAGVEAGDIIGRTGQTGLAVGDHLHYGVYIHGVPVHPLEWWDRSWIHDNILSALEQAEAEFGVAEGHVGFLPERAGGSVE